MYTNEDYEDEVRREKEQDERDEEFYNSDEFFDEVEDQDCELISE